MGVKYEARQDILINVIGTEEQMEAWVEEYNEDSQRRGFKSYAEYEGDDFISITSYGQVTYYPSNNYYDPDEYEYDEIFLDDFSDRDIVMDWFKDSPLQVTNIKILDIEESC